MACVAVGLIETLGASSAMAQTGNTVEPLNQYVVSGHVDTDALARAGFDMREAGVPGSKGKFFIVARPSQAAQLAKDGATVTAPFGVAKAMAAPPSPLTPPTHGYNVYRPWSLTPAPCPQTCTTPLTNLKTYYHQLARDNPDVVKEEVIGHSVLGQEIMAYKVTKDAKSERDGDRPAVLYDATQHAREWISTEVERRLFTYMVTNKKQKGGADIKQLLNKNELWFIPVVNVDGYDYTFVNKGSRLWRKNLRDVNGGGFSQDSDGVDTNRNFPGHWNYDQEGASADPANETYHGSGPASEPEVQAVRGLERRVGFKFQIDYHSFAQLILYPEGWQVETEGTDSPLTAALAGDDDNPAVPGFDPDVSAELYTTNGDINDDALHNFGVMSYTVELDGGTGADVGGTVDGPDSFSPGGFVFQDSEADIQAEFQKNLAFALDLARSAKDPENPVSHLFNTAPEFVPTTFGISYGDPQTVEVDAKKSLGNVRVYWQVNNGAVHWGPTSEYEGGQRHYGDPGVYYHHLRGVVTGTKPGDSVKVWFQAGQRHASDAFTYAAKAESSNKVLLMVAEDYTGASPVQTGGPKYLDTYAKALTDARIGYDVYDVDAQGRTAPSTLGVLSHYKAVIWETGEDLYTRGPDQPGGTGVAKTLDDEIIAARDYMNDGGKLLVAGKTALQGAWDQFLYNPLSIPPAPYCASNQTAGQGATADDPPGQNFNCVATSNDFQQYWLGAYLPITLSADPDEIASFTLLKNAPLGSGSFTLNGTDSAANQDNLYSFLTTSSILPAATYPQFTSDPVIKRDGPPAFDPKTGTHYAYTGQSSSAYMRLTRTVDLTSATAPTLQFAASYDTEPNFDYVFVEAHTVGQDDWTTLPDLNGHTSNDTGAGCPDPDPFWLDENPFLRHYITRDATTDPPTCTPTGTSGAWNASTGNSAGYQDWKVDLSAYKGKQVELSITYVTDPATVGLGVFLDDVSITDGATTLSTTSFEDGLGGWAVPGAPADSGANGGDWRQTASVGFVDGVGVQTRNSLYFGFGLEGVTGAADRAALVKDSLRTLGVR
jgi:hypothetical protein